MKFQPETAEGVNLIARHDPASTGQAARVVVGNQAYGHSLLVPWKGAVLDWGAETAAALTSAHFEQLLALKPELVIFGSGARLVFQKPAQYRALIERGIGLETMDTPAACRTYNVLASEGRCVVAALILGA